MNSLDNKQYHILKIRFDVLDFKSLATDVDNVVAGAVAVEGEAHGAGGIEADAFVLGAIVDVSVAGEYGVHTILLEEGYILLALLCREVEIIFRLVNCLPDNRAVHEDEDVLRAFRGFKLFCQLLELLLLELGLPVFYAVRVDSDEGAAVLADGEARVAMEFCPALAAFRLVCAYVVVTGKFVDGRLNQRSVGEID